MKCQKCSKPAVIHLTEIVTDPAGMKRPVEIHLCLHHAAEAGIIAPGSEILPQVLSGNPTPTITPKKSDVSKGAPSADTGLPTAIVPTSPGGGLVVARDKSGDPAACPVCGTTWSQFKQSGLMGCSHDYALYEGKLLPLLKRAQEGSTEHVGKIPQVRKTQDTDRQIETLRLRRDLQKAIDAEDYERAARVRDALKRLEAEE